MNPLKNILFKQQYVFHIIIAAEIFQVFFCIVAYNTKKNCLQLKINLYVLIRNTKVKYHKKNSLQLRRNYCGFLLTQDENIWYILRSQDLATHIFILFTFYVDINIIVIKQFQKLKIFRIFFLSFKWKFRKLQN